MGAYMIDVLRNNPSLEQIAAKPQLKNPDDIKPGRSRWYLGVIAATGLSLVLASGCASEGPKPTLTPRPLPTREVPVGNNIEDKAQYDETVAVLNRVLDPSIINRLVSPRYSKISRAQSKEYALKAGRATYTMFEPIDIQTQMIYDSNGRGVGFTAEVSMSNPHLYVGWEFAEENRRNFIAQFPNLAKFLETSSEVNWAKMPAGSEPEFAKKMLNLPEDTVWITRKDLRYQSGGVFVFGRGKLADGTPYLVEVNTGDRFVSYREGDTVKDFESSLKQGDVIILAERYLGVESGRVSESYPYRALWRLKPVSDQNGEAVWSILNPAVVEGGITARVQYGPNGELLGAKFEGTWIAIESLIRKRARFDRQLTLTEVASVVFGASVENTKFQEDVNKLEGTMIKFGKTEADDKESMRFIIDDDGFRVRILDLNSEGRPDKTEKSAAVNFGQLFAPHKFTASGHLKPRFASRNSIPKA